MPAFDGSASPRQSAAAAAPQSEAGSRAKVIGVTRMVVVVAAVLGLLAVVGLGSQDTIRGAAPFLARHLREREPEGEESSIGAGAGLAEDEESRFLASELEEEEDATNSTLRPNSDGNATSGDAGSNASDGEDHGAGTTLGSPVCGATGKDCYASECCSTWQDSCFETREGEATCMRSCTPGGDRSCRTPFAPFQAQARETYAWPEIVAVCAPGEALIRSAAFAATYEGSCDVYCRRGAGQAVAPELAQFWVSVPVPGSGELGHCLGDTDEAAPEGIFCLCSFPDRL